MFGEDASESPRQPSPWYMLSTSASSQAPSPLSLATTPSTTSSAPGTPPLISHHHQDKHSTSHHGETMIRAGLASSHSTLFDPSAVAVATAEPKIDSMFDHAGCDEVFDLADDLGGIGMIDPEVDKTGHIEYKLKLPTPNTPYRLAKLITQLKWRLIEGGGSALYELGCMDNGLLVGLPLEEMQESLSTLGRMLAGLGGGQVRVLKVIRVGGSPTNHNPDGKADNELNDSDDSVDDPVVDTASTERLERRPSASTLFKTFTVEAVTDPTIYTVASEDNDKESDSVSPVFRPSHALRVPAAEAVTIANKSPPSNVQTGSGQHSRTPEERSLLRRQKRDARRARRRAASALVDRQSSGSTGDEESTLVAPVVTRKSDFDLGAVSIEARTSDGAVVVVGSQAGGGAGSGGRRNSPLPATPISSSSSFTESQHIIASTSSTTPLSPKLDHKKKQLCARTLSKLTGCPNPFKPQSLVVVGQKGGQERFVVEALVTKRIRQGTTTTGRRSDSSDEDPTSSVEGELRTTTNLKENSSTSLATRTLSLSGSEEDDDEGLEGWGYLDFSLPKVSRKGGDHAEWIATGVSVA
ncbi:hypothetical protein ACM66B_005048 [Microbotryomycetes sp. NB124-2]